MSQCPRDFNPKRFEAYCEGIAQFFPNLKFKIWNVKSLTFTGIYGSKGSGQLKIYYGGDENHLYKNMFGGRCQKMLNRYEAFIFLIYSVHDKKFCISKN